MAPDLLLFPFVKTIATYLRAFGDRYTYDFGRNPYVAFGFFWGLPVPIFSFALDFALTGVGGRVPFDALKEHPIHLFFLAHPILFSLLFGAMGTVRRSLERENARLVATLTEMAMTDPLTGLYNRRYVLEELRNSLHRAQRSGEPVAIVLFDLDDFKAVNDRQGHTAGDQVLRAVARALQTVLRQGDVLGRYGGDEFLLVLAGGMPEDGRVVERAMEAVLRDTGMHISAGVGRFPDNGASPDMLINAADAWLSRVKREHNVVRSHA